MFLLDLFCLKKALSRAVLKLISFSNNLCDFKRVHMSNLFAIINPDIACSFALKYAINLYKGCSVMFYILRETIHYDDVRMGAIASQITSLAIVYSAFYSGVDKKKNIKAPRHWPLCGEFTGTGEFPAQRASYAENVSIWWRHHEIDESFMLLWCLVLKLRWNSFVSCSYLGLYNMASRGQIHIVYRWLTTGRDLKYS